MAITKEVLDELLKDYKGPEDITGTDGLLKQLTKALVDRAMDAEMTMHLGYEKNDRSSMQMQPVSRYSLWPRFRRRSSGDSYS